MTDEQHSTSTWTNPVTSTDAPLAMSESPTGTEPPPATRMSRRMVFLLAGIGVSGAAALGAGAYAFYEPQSTGQGTTTPSGQGGRMPQGYGSAMPGGGRSGMPSGARPSGARPSGTRPGGQRGPGGNASSVPTDQPS